MVDAGGSLQTAYASKIQCGHARRRKIAGLVVNGALRDIDAIASWNDFAAYALRKYGERSFVQGARFRKF